MMVYVLGRVKPGGTVSVLNEIDPASGVAFTPCFRLPTEAERYRDAHLAADGGWSVYTLVETMFSGGR